MLLKLWQSSDITSPSSETIFCDLHLSSHSTPGTGVSFGACSVSAGYLCQAVPEDAFPACNQVTKFRRIVGGRVFQLDHNLWLLMLVYPTNIFYCSNWGWRYLTLMWTDKILPCEEMYRKWLSLDESRTIGFSKCVFVTETEFKFFHLLLLLCLFSSWILQHPSYKLSFNSLCMLIRLSSLLLMSIAKRTK